MIITRTTMVYVCICVVMTATLAVKSSIFRRYIISHCRDKMTGSAGRQLLAQKGNEKKSNAPLKALKSN